MAIAGAARVSITITASIAAARGRRPTAAAHRPMNDSSAATGAAAALRSLRGVSRAPASAHSAGTTTSVAASIATTAIAVANPNDEYVGSPASRNPISDTSTVVAAITAERPAVATDLAADSTTSCPSRRYST